MATPVPTTSRTLGDGMEEESPKKVAEINDNESPLLIKQVEKVGEKIQLKPPFEKVAEKTNLPIPGLHTLYRHSSELVSRSLPAVEPKGKLYLLQPRLIKKTETPEHKKNRPPKFIPFEPYLGATNPIIPKANTLKYKSHRNNLDINVLVSQMSNMKSEEMENPKRDITQAVDERIFDSIQKENVKLKEERDYFQSQLKFQVKVNSELKNLLVASVGEDLQTRVNLLTEDKLHLAKALLDTAKNLTTHTEQIEFLAGQCEVWRSKFLASSVMIEELARWKADLTTKSNLLTESNKRILQQTAQVREMQLHMLKNLKFLAKLKTINLPSSDTLTLGSECLNITDQMVLHTGVGMPENLNLRPGLNQYTDAEKYALQALTNTNLQLIPTEEASFAIVDQAQRRFSMKDENLDLN